MQWQRDNFTVSDDKTRLDIDMVFNFLTNAYWSPGIPRETVERGIANSLCSGVYDGQKQVGFARCITDYATLVFLKDVFILQEMRGYGLGKWLVECIINHPEIRNVRKWMLNTADAHGLYARHGFKVAQPGDRLMERYLD